MYRRAYPHGRVARSAIGHGRRSQYSGSEKLDAQLHKNSAALDVTFDDGLMWVDESGTLVTTAGYLENLRNSASTQLRIETMQLEIFDQVVIVFGIYEGRGVSAGQPYHDQLSLYRYLGAQERQLGPHRGDRDLTIS